MGWRQEIEDFVVVVGWRSADPSYSLRNVNWTIGSRTKPATTADLRRASRSTIADKAPPDQSGGNYAASTAFFHAADVGVGVMIMGSTADKASGLANEAIGKIKQGVGSAVGSDKLKAEGAAQELEGHAQKVAGDAKAAVKDGANKVADAVNKNL